MKLHTKTLLVISILTPLAFSGTAMAHEATMNMSASEHAAMQADETKKAEALKMRLDQRKAELKTKLETAEKTNIQLKCKGSQGTLSKLSGRMNGLETSRKKTYGNLTTRLTSLSQKLKAKNVDTSELDQEIAELQSKIDAFYASLDNYKQAVSDLSTMDCATDPEAYKASLESGRTLRTETHHTSMAVQDYLKETIKPTLQTLRTNLSTQKTSGEDNQ